MRITGPTLKVLGVLLDSRLGSISGAEVAKRTHLASGTLYPILFRLEHEGWASSEWEAVEPAEVKRPRRRLYKLTGLGESESQNAFRDLLASRGAAVWA